MRFRPGLVLLACLFALAPAAPALAQGQTPPSGYYDDHGYSHDSAGNTSGGYYDSAGYWHADSDGAPAPGPAPVPTAVPTPGPTVAPPAPVPTPVQPPLAPTPTVGGKVALLRRNGKAAIPRGAPASVRAILAAGNKIVGLPYKWGGGPAKLVDRGYDCSGTVSFALIRAGLLPYPLVSGTFARWGEKGTGRWVSIYANAGHVYMEVAGLRLDTSSMGDPAGGSGPRWRPVIGHRKGFRTRHPAGF